MKWLHGILGASAAIALATGGARAASISLEPAATTVQVGSLLSVAVVGTGFALGTDGGDFFVDWSGGLAFVSFTVDDPPWDLSSVDTSEASFGSLTADVASFAETPGSGGGPFAIGTLVLAATQSGVASVGIFPYLVGWSLAGEVLPGLEFSGDTAIAIVPAPEPDAGALCAAALGLLLAAGSAGHSLARN